MIDEELDIIIDEWWNQNLKLRIMTDINGADEKDFIIDSRLLEEEYENINRTWKDLYEIYKKEKNEEGIIDVLDKKNRAEAGYRLLNAFYEDPEKTLEKLNERLHKEVEWDTEIRVFPKFKVKNAPEIEISKLNHTHIGKLIQIRGTIKTVSETLNRILEGAWVCQFCGNINYVHGDKRPKYCEGCGKKRGETDFIIDMQKSTVESFKELIVQENLDATKTQYDSIKVLLKEEYMSKFGLGDKVVITGFLKTNDVFKKSQHLKEFYLEALWIDKYEERIIELTNEDIERIREFSKKGNILQELAKLYAPAIIGYENIKKAIILQAVGGVQKIKKGTKIRGNIHILLIGDPGTAKSQLLMWNKNAVPKSIYVNDASGVGLTVAVTKTDDHLSLDAGVMVLANEGVACIDELDKLRAEDREAIHGAMEQGVIDVHKAKFHITAPSNTSVLASANPKLGRFDPSKMLIEQISLPPTILNRFDLIFFIMDKINDEDKEMEFALRILSNENEEGDPQFLMKYLVYAKSFSPVITDRAISSIAKKYAKIRMTGQNGKIPINARNLEGIKRLAEAHAKLRLSNEVTEDDVNAVFEIMGEYLAQLGNDVDSIVIPADIRTEAMKLLELIREYNYIEYTKIRQLAEQEGIKNIDTALNVLVNTKEIVEIGNGYAPRGENYGT
ncbi:MAG: ATP-binding protein [Thermoplasmata archaeon]